MDCVARSNFFVRDEANRLCATPLLVALLGMSHMIRAKQFSWRSFFVLRFCSLKSFKHLFQTLVPRLKPNAGAVVEGSDIIFAADSIPAIFGVSTDPYIVCALRPPRRADGTL